MDYGVMGSGGTGRYENLNAMQIDVLREIGNIGAGNAATSLSVMMNQPVNVSLPKVRLVEFDDVVEAMGGSKTISYGVLINLEGDVEGMIMFVLDKSFAHRILNVLMKKSYMDFDDLDEMALSAINEVGNILSASYANSIAELTGLRIHFSVPYVLIDTAGSILSVPIVKFKMIGDKVLYIEENFKSNNESVLSHMVLFAEIDSLNLILGKLGLM